MEPLTDEQRRAALEELKSSSSAHFIPRKNPIVQEFIHYITHNDDVGLEPLLTELPARIYIQVIPMFYNPPHIQARLNSRPSSIDEVSRDPDFISLALQKSISPLSIAAIYGADKVAELLIETYNAAQEGDAFEKQNIKYHLNHINYMGAYVQHTSASRYRYIYTPLRWAIVNHERVNYDPSANKDATALILLNEGATYPNLSHYEFDDGDHFRERRPTLMLPATVRRGDSVILHNLMIDDMLTSILAGIPFVESFDYILKNRTKYNLPLDYIVSSILNRPYTPVMMPYFISVFKEYDVGAYYALLTCIANAVNPEPYFIYVFRHGVDPFTTNSNGENTLFLYADSLKRGESVEQRVDKIKRLLALVDDDGDAIGINQYMPNHSGETAATRAIKRGLPQAIIDALNTRNLDRIYDLKERNPYAVERTINKFTKKRARNAPNSYKNMLVAALENGEIENNARVAFKPSNIPNTHGRTGKNYEKMSLAQRQRHLEANPPAFNGRGGARTRRHRRR
jgi:hypothetical protein